MIHRVFMDNLELFDVGWIISQAVERRHPSRAEAMWEDGSAGSVRTLLRFGPFADDTGIAKKL
jgi:hypothetical protein